MEHVDNLKSVSRYVGHKASNFLRESAHLLLCMKYFPINDNNYY